MENPLIRCKPKDPVPNLFIHQQNPIQIPSRFPRPRPPAPSPSPASPAHKTSGRQPKRLSRNDKLLGAISAAEKGSPARPNTYISLLQSCIDTNSIEDGRRLHSLIAASGEETSPFVETKLVSMYAKCGSLNDARRVFDGMRERNLFAWSAMIGGCARQQRWEEVVDLFFRMMNEGVAPDSLLLPKILQACGNTGDVETGRLLHSIAVRAGFLATGIHSSNSILAMYAKCGEMVMAKRFFEKMESRDRVSWNSVISGHSQHGEIKEAVRLFEQMRDKGMEPGLVTWNILISIYNQSGRLVDLATELMKQMESSGLVPDVFTWTSMISGFAQNKRASHALDFFQKMQQSGVEPNGMTIASAVSACASLKNLYKGRELHACAIKNGSSGDALVGNPVLDMYAKCGRLQEAQRVFNEILDKDVFTWNSMIGGYMQAGYSGKAYELFSGMENSIVRQNVVTWNVMISGYIQNGDEERAMELFHRMETEGVRRNAASWNALIAGSLQNGHVNKALAIFRQMQVASVIPNSVTILTILPVCTNLVSIAKVKEIHACILKRDLQSNISIGNALIHTYSKSGEIHSARLIFNGLLSRDLISWNSAISAYVLHGCSKFALDLFYQMKKEGLTPNQATLASVINAYSLSGMINEGKKLFSGMTEDYQLSPGLEHYRAMIELFGRSGRLREASDFIETMPIEPDFAIWEALFTAARIYENIKLACYAAENMIKLEPRNVRTCRLLRLVYTFSENPDAANLRKPNKSTNADSTYGCCWIEVRNNVHTFLTGQQPTKHSKPMYVKLNDLRAEMKTAVSDHSDTDLDIEEEKEETVGIHSEKLAFAFALVNAPQYRSIRIIKSARMCTDCHTTAKLISKRFQREILLKDPKCLHHFKDGSCSCKDYW